MITVAIGMGGGMLYDCIRIARRTFKHTFFWIQLEDLLYWITVAWFFFFILFHHSYGEIRGFSILGSILGAVLYYLILSKWVMKVSIAVVEFIKKVCRTVWRIILIPVKLIKRLLLYPYRWVNRCLHYSEKKAKTYSRKTARYGYRKIKKAKKSLFIMFRKV